MHFGNIIDKPYRIGHGWKEIVKCSVVNKDRYQLQLFLILQGTKDDRSPIGNLRIRFVLHPMMQAKHRDSATNSHLGCWTHNRGLLSSGVRQRNRLGFVPVDVQAIIGYKLCLFHVSRPERAEERGYLRFICRGEAGGDFL